VRGKSNQLPHHQGLSIPLLWAQIHPSSSAWLYANSAALLRAYIAIVTLNCSDGYTASIKPARLAPIAGARLEVRDRPVLLFRWRNGRASGDRRCARSRVKKRKRMRWRRRIVDIDNESRKFGLFQNGNFFPLTRIISIFSLHIFWRTEMSLLRALLPQNTLYHQAIQLQRRARRDKHS